MMIVQALKDRLPGEYSDYDPIVFFGINQVKDTIDVLQFLEKIVVESITRGSCITKSASEVNGSGQYIFHVKIQFPPTAVASSGWAYKRKTISRIVDTLSSVIPDTKHESSMHPPEEKAPLINIIITRYSMWDDNNLQIEFKVNPSAFPCYAHSLEVIDIWESEARDEMEDIKESIIHEIGNTEEGKAIISLLEKLRTHKEEKSNQILKLQEECGSIGALIRDLNNRIHIIKDECFYSDWIQEEVKHVKKQTEIEKDKRLDRCKYLAGL